MAVQGRYEQQRDPYVSRVLAMPRLERERELMLARAYHAGDRTAANELVTANLRHVVPHALRYRYLGLPLAELIAQGNLGLMRALQTFDPEHGVRFASYANPWIRAEMLGIALQSRSMVGGKRSALTRNLFRIRREHGHLCARLGDEDGVCQLLADRYRKQPAEIAELIQRMELRDASLDAPVGGGDGQRSLLDRLAAELEEPRSAAEQRAIAQAVSAALSGLSERERYVVEHRLMADEEVRLSLSDIGHRFAVSRERARQIEQAVKSKLRSRLLTVARQLELEPT
jgi:RNA polymerase sigma-32 factor